MAVAHGADALFSQTWAVDGRTFRLIQGPRSYRSRVAALPGLRHSDIAATYTGRGHGNAIRTSSVSAALSGAVTCSRRLVEHIHDCVVKAEAEARANTDA